MNFRPKFVDLFSLVTSKGRTHTLTDSKRGKIRKMTILRYETSLRNPRVVMIDGTPEFSGVGVWIPGFQDPEAGVVVSGVDSFI